MAEYDPPRIATRRFNLTAVAFPMTAAVAFGIGIVAVLTIPALNAHAMWLIPAVVVASLVVGAVSAWYVAPRMRNRHERDVISG